MKIKICIILLSISIALFEISAKEYPKVNFPLSGNLLMGFTGTPINFSAIVPNVTSSMLTTLNSPSRKTTYKNTIELVIKNNYALDEDAEVVVTAKLTYYPVNGNPSVSVNTKLSVNFKTGNLQKSNIENIYTFDDAYRVDISVTSVDVYGANVPQLKNKLKDFIELIVSFQEISYRVIDYNTQVSALNSCEDKTTDELIIKWNPNDEAEEYELEYTFIDNYSDVIGIYLSPSSLKFNFKKNSTRIQTKDNYYRLPLIFESGYILFRVRIIGKGGQNIDQPVYCKWTGNSDNGLVSSFPNKYLHNNPHNDKINWQVSTSFTEEGKRSDVVKYYDGTFRQRQEVSGVNLEKQMLSNLGSSISNNISSGCDLPGTEKNREVIAGEKVYDFQGRPAIDIMPSPTNSLKIQYLSKLNVSQNSQNPYNWSDFDKPSFECASVNPLSTSMYNNVMGASTYYSNTNANKWGFNSFIPDAGQYPFTHTTYLQDNTNKISVQSGLGSEFKTGSNHETKFLYAAPNQQELDIMFGTEVGYYKRYQKNMVIDPNGQISITYLNPEGKTIATSLAGDSPQNVEALDNIADNTINVPLLSDISPIDRTMISEHQFTVEKNNSVYNFNYSLVPPSLNVNVCAENLCLDCIYDIEITLNHVESCSSTPIFEYTGTIGQLLNGSIIDLNCNNNISTGLYPRQINQVLNIGTYNITKKITVNEDAAIQYVNEIFKDTCQAEWQNILNDELSKIDTNDCFNSCLECDNPPVQTDNCDPNYCSPKPNRCDIIRGMMLADVYPMAQYGKFIRDNNNQVIAHNFPNSVFYTADNDKKQRLISIINSMSSVFQFNTNLDLNVDNELQLVLTEMINNWQPVYAEYLIQLHPEYCMLGWCNQPGIKEMLDFDVELLSTEFYQDALTKGLIDPVTTYGQIIDKDPWFTSNPTYRPLITNALQNYGCGNSTLPADLLAMQLAYCASITTLPPMTLSDPGPSPQMNSNLIPACDVNNMPPHVFGSLNADLEWRYIRSIYLSAKENLIQLSLFSYGNLQSPRCLPCGNTNDIQCRFTSPVSTSLNAVNNSDITSVDLTSINSSDPCEVLDAVNNQSSAINNEFQSFYCGNNGSYTPGTGSSYTFPNSSGIVLTLTPSDCDSCCFNMTISGPQTWAWNAFKLSVNYNAITAVNPATGFNIVSSSSGNVVITKNNIFQNGDFVGRICFSQVTSAYPVSVKWSTNSGAVFQNEVTQKYLQCPEPGNCQSGLFCDSIPQLPEYPYTNNCVTSLIALAYANASQRYNHWVDSLKNTILADYYDKCLSAVETFTMEYQNRQYHYTLYYYDQAGNLVKTVPPQGVRLLSSTQLPLVESSRSSGYTISVLPQHIKQTVYRYNTLNEVVEQKTPDAGYTKFYYDALGRIVASQNEVQQSEGSYAYSKYDKQGRIEESGKIQTTFISSGINWDPAGWSVFIENQPVKTEITLTKYDEIYSNAVNQKFGSAGQLNLRKRVASVLKFFDKNGLDNSNYTHATHYSYDIQGNVFKLIQDYPNTPVGDKSIEYEYDLHSGKVNKVIYQRGFADQFLHKYSYDALNRLIRVKTSPNGYIWATDAEYFYYRHGPLARLELGTDKVQGLDYMYTLQGWIKGVNGVTLNTETDMGKDGHINPNTGNGTTKTVNGMTVNMYNNSQLFGNSYLGPNYSSLHSNFGQDAFGYILGYFYNDYLPIESSANTSLNAFNQQTGNMSGLYNGNISRMYTQLKNLGNMGFDYKYDQLNRFISQDGWRLDQNSPFSMSALNNLGYSMKMSYDADGNISGMQRNGTESNPKMDDMKYHYYTLTGNTYSINPGTLVPSDATNRLAYVTDGVSQSSYSVDIDNQNTGNYTFDAIGNLIGDAAEDINDIDWNLQNKVQKIHKTNYSLFFDYDALGNRVQKFLNDTDPTKNEHTFYVRDAQGNIMSVYSYKIKPGEYDNTPQFFWEEAHLYGSSRLGTYNPELTIQNYPVSQYYRGNRGYKNYELTNHLGNVLAVITDRKLQDLQSGSNNYTADISTSQDYYPFGMLMPDRNNNTNKFRFGFNGKESDNDIKGLGNQQDYGMRIYDSRIGKFLSIDPISKKYPWYTPYQFAGNKPIWATDLDGLEENTATTYVKPPIVFYGTNGMTNTNSQNNNSVSVIDYMINFVSSLESKMKGNSTWDFGVTFSSKSQNSNQNQSDASKASSKAHLINIDADTFSEFEMLLGVLKPNDIGKTKDGQVSTPLDKSYIRKKDLSNQRNSGQKETPFQKLENNIPSLRNAPDDDQNGNTNLKTLKELGIHYIVHKDLQGIDSYYWANPDGSVFKEWDKVTPEDRKLEKNNDFKGEMKGTNGK